MTINVVYLAYFNENIGYNLNIVERFLDSYKKKPAGIEHSLTIIAKNCANKNTYNNLCLLAQKNKAKVVDLPDDGWDFGSYFRISKMIKDEYIFFCGGYVQILADNWLKNFYNAFLNNNTIQLAGAMGSWGDSKNQIFPNYHIRTTAFMLKREVFLEYSSTQKYPETKEDTYEMEHGQSSLTKFILNKGYKAVVVDCDGKVFEPEDWDESKTFRYPSKSKSIFADRHTAKYDISDEKEREFLERAAWGRSLKQTKVKIFVAHEKEGPFFNSEIFQPLFIGAHSLEGCAFSLKDNIGENISAKNNYYGELTGQYCVWKNLLSKLSTEYIGFCNYTKFLDFNISDTDNIVFKDTIILEFSKVVEKYTEENIFNFIQGSDIVLPQKILTPKRLYDLYLDSSPKEEIDSAISIIKEDYPDYFKTVQKIINGNEIYANLVFVIKRELFGEYVQWIFDILTKLEQKINMSKYEKLTEKNDVFANIAEVLLNVWIEHMLENKNIKIKESTSVSVDFDVNNYLKSFITNIQKKVN